MWTCSIKNNFSETDKIYLHGYMYNESFLSIHKHWEGIIVIFNSNSRIVADIF